MLKRLLKFTLIFITGVWVGHLLVFSNLVNFFKNEKDSKLHTRAIVVLTGSKGRIEHGFKLLEKGYGDTLFITGVGKDINLDQVVSALKVSQTFKKEQVHLDHGAKNTKANAKAIKKWTDQNNIKNVRLVTSRLHMPRSFLWLNRYVPDLKLIANPVPNKKGFPINHTVKEFHKWMFASWGVGQL